MLLPTSVIGGKADDVREGDLLATTSPITNPWGPGVTMNFNLANALALPSVFLNQENWFYTGCFKALPAVSEWSDFDDCHVPLRSPRSANMFILP
jgi:hypothetical protein